MHQGIGEFEQFCRNKVPSVTEQGAPLKDRIAEPLYRGCLLGGAVGDALGAAIEFDSLAAIRNKHGSTGLTDYAPGYDGIGKFTDDTQMLLFVAEGLLNAVETGCRAGGKDVIEHLTKTGFQALQRWLRTQNEQWSDEFGRTEGLLGQKELHASRAPGNTCTSSLRTDVPRSIANPVNHSKGCGGIMRIAPVGLLGFNDPFLVGAELAALTHGHPCGYLSAGFMAELVHLLVQGNDLRSSIDRCMDRLVREPDHEQTADAVRQAVQLAERTTGKPEDVEKLGGAWVGEEALAISLYCALLAEDFEHGVLMAVNHGGDSDSTGAITGNILGLVHGEEAIPKRWLEPLELRELIEEMAQRLFRARLANQG